MSKRALVIASTTGYQTRIFTEAAAQLGFTPVLATDRCHVLDDPWADQAVPIRFEDPEGSAAVLAQQGSVAAIVALGDRTPLIASLAAAQLGIPYNSPEAIVASRNKYLARQRFQSAGLPVPEFFRVERSSDPEMAAPRAAYPCVLKPLGLSASRGVIRANTPAEFRTAFKRIQALLGRPEVARYREEHGQFIQVERFIPGREFALEGILSGGRLRVIALFDKPDPLDGPFFEETIYVTPSREPEFIQAAIHATAESAIRALGLTEGPIHAEMRANEQGVWMLEVAARPIGGLCARVLPDLAELILRRAAGEDVSSFPVSQGAAGVMMIPIPAEGVYDSVSGLEAARAVPLVEDAIITAKQGQMLVPLPEGNSYLGFLFARGEEPGEVEAALRAAHSRLDFHLLKALPLLS